MNESQPMAVDNTDVSEPDQTAGRFDMGSPIANAVYDLLAVPVATAGVELTDVEWTGRSLRLVIDAEGGVTTERLAEVNRLVSPLLDQHDPVPGRYLLEVSSPGVERPLRRSDHFRRAVGEQVIVKRIPGADPRRVRGELKAADDEHITVVAAEIDGVELSTSEIFEIPYSDISKARTQFDWGPGPKPGSKPGSKNRPKSGAKNQPAKPSKPNQTKRRPDNKRKKR